MHSGINGARIFVLDHSRRVQALYIYHIFTRYLVYASDGRISINRGRGGANVCSRIDRPDQLSLQFISSRYIYVCIIHYHTPAWGHKIDLRSYFSPGRLHSGYAAFLCSRALVSTPSARRMPSSCCFSHTLEIFFPVLLSALDAAF